MTVRKAAGKTHRTEKVTVSLPRDLLEFADGIARGTGESRSSVIANALEVIRRAQQEALLEEGYRFYADIDVELAEKLLPAAMEVWPRD